MALKYDQNLRGLNCDLTNFTEKNSREAFCWAFDPIHDDRNFIPRAISVGTNTCSGWALSFFESEKAAKNRLKKLMVKNPLLYIRLGTHVAQGLLTPESGVSETANSDGHYNHHEYLGNEFRHVFINIGLSYT
jgi:hypothetical protein